MNTPECTELGKPYRLRKAWGASWSICLYCAEMDQNKTTLERAFELAKSGRFKSASDLKRAVAAEGYQKSQLDGPSLTRQLTAIIKSNLVSTSEEP